MCTLAIQTAGSRMLFSLARDGMLPGSRLLGRVSERRGTPILPAVAVGVMAVGVLVVNVGQAQLFAALGSLAVVIVYLAYLGVTGPLLLRRLRGWPATVSPPGGPARFSLGRWGLPVNLAAVAWGAFICINTAWPRPAVYDPGPTHHWYLHYFSLLFIAVALIVGAITYGWARRSASVRAVAEETPTTAGAAAIDPAARQSGGGIITTPGTAGTSR